MSKKGSRVKLSRQSQSTTDLIAENRSKIEAIKISNKRLREELRTQEQRSRLNFKGSQSEIDKLQENRLNLIKRIEAQYLVLQKLQEVYQAKRQEHKAYHDKMAEIDGNNNFSLKKTIQRERNRNQKLKTKMNETKADLKLQRDKINKFRKERTLLDKMYNKLEITIKKKARDYLKLIEGVQHVDKKREKLIKQMEEIKNSAENDLAIIETRYNNIINKGSDLGTPQEGTAAGEEEADIDEFERMDHLALMEKGKKVRLETERRKSTRRTGKGDGEIEATAASIPQSDVDPSEEELSNLRDLFSKMKLQLQIGEFDEMKEFYHSSESIKDQLWEDLQKKETEIDEYKLSLKLKKEKIEELKKKKKTNKEFIEEDKSGYHLASRIVEHKTKNEKFVVKNEDLDDEIVRIDRFIDSIMGNTLSNVDHFWKKRVKVLAKRQKNKKKNLVEQAQDLAEDKMEAGEDQIGSGDLAKAVDNDEAGESNQGEAEEKRKKTEENQEKEKEGEPKKENQENQQEGDQEGEVKEGEGVKAEQEGGENQDQLERDPEKKPEEKAQKQLSFQMTEREKELEEIKKAEFKKEIIDLQLSEKQIKDQELRTLKAKTDTYVTRDVRVLRKIKWLEKLSEDVNLLTNFIKNQKVDASKIKSLHKPMAREELNNEEVDKDITGTTYNYFLNRKKDDWLITKDMRSLKKSTILEVHGLIHKQKKGVRRNYNLHTTKVAYPK